MAGATRRTQQDYASRYSRKHRATRRQVGLVGASRVLENGLLTEDRGQGWDEKLRMVALATTGINPTVWMPSPREWIGGRPVKSRAQNRQSPAKRQSRGSKRKLNGRGGKGPKDDRADEKDASSSRNR
ncbi:hypothetical protein VDBG_06815 [Verticillium alfalfae VaMs.102]|uniref:Uncharacterized protein n=1 Tax=Verticillium alfalfae (strain VaMs.102 / ATCC MYA-4576 / FGSC 10136) TaxID=526221 RepID=C9SPJ0_VERA1|nr:hypothetical protein VDBG_06815 [Verticillium alfalfae VaMs.102]EEY20705.1 hypothetical protein VDBG_06815 [Verticillium alfalfae VaMs.102]